MSRISDFHLGHANIDASVLGISIDGYEKRNAVNQVIQAAELSFRI